MLHSNLNKKITGQTGNSEAKDVEIMVPLKYLSNFWKTLAMSLINWETSFQLTWSRNCIIVAGAVNSQKQNLQINDTKLYVSVVTFSTEENIKLLKQLESGFKKTIN